MTSPRSEHPETLDGYANALYGLIREAGGAGYELSLTPVLTGSHLDLVDIGTGRREPIVSIRWESK